MEQVLTGEALAKMEKLFENLKAFSWKLKASTNSKNPSKLSSFFQSNFSLSTKEFAQIKFKLDVARIIEFFPVRSFFLKRKQNHCSSMKIKD